MVHCSAVLMCPSRVKWHYNCIQLKCIQRALAAARTAVAVCRTIILYVTVTVACEATYRVYIGSAYTQVAEWFSTSLLVWWLPACLRCRSPSALFVWYFHLVVPRTHTGFGDRAFQVAGPRLWNSLPASLRQSDTTVGQFKKLLKTHLFSWDCGALVTAAAAAAAATTTTVVISWIWYWRLYYDPCWSSLISWQDVISVGNEQ